MKRLIGNCLIFIYTVIVILHMLSSVVIKAIVGFFDTVFGTDVYNVKTRPNIYSFQLYVWLRFRDVHKKYFPEDVEEINRIEGEIRDIRKEM